MCLPFFMPNEYEARRFMLQRSYTRLFDQNEGRVFTGSDLSIDAGIPRNLYGEDRGQ